MAEAYIVAAARTAGGRRGGRLKDWHPADLGAASIDAILDRTGIDPAVVEDVIFGCVSQAGEQSVNVARNVVSSSKLPERVPATSVDIDTHVVEEFRNLQLFLEGHGGAGALLAVAQGRVEDYDAVIGSGHRRVLGARS